MGNPARIMLASKSTSESSYARADFGAVYFDDNSPFIQNASMKNRWLMTSTIAGLFGAMLISGAFFFTYEGDQVANTSAGVNAQLASRNPQKTSISNKSDPTEYVIGDIPVLADKSLSGEKKSGNKYTNLQVSFGLAGVKSDQQPGVNDSTGNTAVSSKAPMFASLVPQSDANGPVGTDASSRAPNSATVVKETQDSANTDSNTTENVTRVTKREPQNKASDIPYKTVSVSEGDTLVDILMENGSSKTGAKKIVAALSRQFSPSSLKEGQKVTFSLVPVVSGSKKVMVPNSLELVTASDGRLTVERSKLGKYAIIANASTHSDAEQLYARAKIKSSLYLAARNQGIPDSIIVDMMRIHAYDVDFQREVRAGDSFEVFYGDENTFKQSKSNKILYSSLTLSGTSKGYYRFKTPDDKIIDFYDATGKSAKKFLMRTPINGARLSSGFGMRKHPVLRYTRMHRGVDFAAARGTPIKAAGNGIIEKKGGAGGYGNYIRIRHANGYKTAYGHMSRYASGVSRGKRVRQGQVIGYVGSTGRSTGNHLHYEVWVNGKATNPMRVRVPTGRRLTGKMLALFKKQVTKINKHRKVAPEATRVANARKTQLDDI